MCNSDIHVSPNVILQAEQITTEYKILAKKYHPDKVETTDKIAGKLRYTTYYNYIINYKIDNECTEVQNPCH